MKRVVQKAKHAHHRLVSLPTLVIIALIIIFGWLSLYTLRQNNLGMSALRKAVVETDQGGDKDQIERSLQALQRYVARHMNTSTQVQLSASYQRDALERQQQAAAELGNVALYSRAESECLASGARGSLLAECINDRLSGQAGDLVKLPDPRLYRYSFAAPYLSLDLAGLTVLGFGLFFYAGLHQLAVFITRRLKRRRGTRGLGSNQPA